MRVRAALGCGFLLLASVQGQEAAALRIITSIRIDGGDDNDRRFARAALGLREGQAVDEVGFQRALAAVRLVDRYRSVEGTFEGGTVLLRLQPLAPVAEWRWEGDPIPAKVKKTLLPDLRKGQRLGPQRLATLEDDAEQQLRDAGFRRAKITASLEEGGRRLRLAVVLGTPRIIQELRIEGDPAPYTRERLLRVAGVSLGHTAWTPAAQRDAQRRLRHRLVKDDRLEGSVSLAPQEGADGILVLKIQPGPKVKLKAKGMDFFGPFLGRPWLSEFVPLARAERYAPSLLDEGAGRITAYYRDQGYPEARVTYVREVTVGTAERPEAVTITYTVVRGPRRVLGTVSFEGNRELPESELREAASLPKRLLLLPPHAKAEAVKALEDRVTAHYLQRGFPEVRVRRRVESNKAGSVDVRLLIREGQRRTLDALTLELPPDPAFPRERLAQSLLLVLGERPVPISGTSRYRSDRRHLQGIEGTLELTAEGARLSFKPALPLVRNDLALVVADLRQRLSSLGAATPQVRLALDDDVVEPVVRVQVPLQPLDITRRLVVQGSDRTRAEAVLRETEALPGAPLDPAKLDEGQIQLGGLGAFNRVDLLTLKDLLGQEKEPWQRGDLALRLQERNPWVFGESFGYDKTQGYHFGLNAQRLNLGGMGRAVDFGIRAGDQTLDSKPLRKAFPTGDVKRSVDSYSIGYTDPWFLPGSLDSLLAPRTRFRMEGAYIEEAQAAFFARRRRFTPSLEWKLSSEQVVQLGYRFERVEVASNRDSQGKPLIADQDLFLLARTPARSIISAPYLQVTVDRRDKPYDPTQGTFFLGRLEFANQVFGTSPNSSFVKLDMRHQWNWPVGFQAEHGVVMASVRVGLARPTAGSAKDLPLSERFFGGGPFTVRGVEPDMLGTRGKVTTTDTTKPPGEQTTVQTIPLGGQALAVLNLEYRFPLIGQSVWAEVFADSGQVYRSLLSEEDPADPTKRIPASFPALRTTLGVGLIFKLGFPLKVEYAADWKRIMGRPRTEEERDTQLKSLLISAGFQF
ncbi:BamA/TamA family outer membrane protein [Geothrix sp. 21YS21S-4]|uniref:BamA/TamA family outer membrane protein n=1 Tax=Geothrix sp. 21YS21S-4 TaxID=3068889 RepID=UPI0027B9260C|nr:BamA/TamA family outer membrane protein [Geothrix sp. 21YS21S-4]